MPRSRFNVDDDDDDDDRPRRRRRRDDDDHDPFRPRKARGGGGPPIGLLIGGGVGLVLLVIGGIVLAVTLRGRREDANANPAPIVVPDVRPVPFPAPPDPFAVVVPKAVPKAPTFGVLLPQGTESVRQLAFSGTADGYVGLIGRTTGISADQYLTVAHAQTGKLIGRVTLPNGESLNGFAVSPTGQFAAVHISVPFDGDVIVVHDLTAKSSKRFTPYSKKGAITNPGLIFVGFSGADRVVTAHETSGFDVWQLPDITRVCGQAGRPPSSMPMIERNGSSMRAKNAALSADGKTMALFDGTGFTFHDTATAAPLAKTERFVQGPTAGFGGAAFSPDGKRFAAITTTYSPKSLTTLTVWDTAKGTRLSSVPMAPGRWGTAMTFWGPDHLLLSQGGFGAADVVAVATGEFVAKVESKITGASHHIAQDSPGGALWYAYERSFNAGGAEPAILASVPAPATLTGARLELTPDGPQWR